MNPLAFVLTTHQGDAHLAHRLLWQLLEHHPRAERVVILDGPVSAAARRALESMATHLEPGEALGRALTRPTAWLERLLTVGLERTSSEIIVKLDPDAWLTRAIRSYPAADLLGTGPPHGSVQGGCYGFRRGAARAILESGLLHTPELQLTNTASANAVWEDEQISLSARALGLGLSDWPEVYSRFRPVLSARELLALGSRYAVLHPIKGHL